MFRWQSPVSFAGDRLGRHWKQVLMALPGLQNQSGELWMVWGLRGG